MGQKNIITWLWGMYKRSEPIKSLHSVQNHMANVYSSVVCLQTKTFPKISKFFFSKNTPKYDKLSKISNISIKTILELRTKFGNFGNFGHISDQLRTIHNTCSNLIGSEPLYILPTAYTCCILRLKAKVEHRNILFENLEDKRRLNYPAHENLYVIFSHEKSCAGLVHRKW